MKKTFLLLLAIVVFGTTQNVFASSYYYTNKNGVNFTEQQYKYYTEMFWDGYQENVTQSDFDKVLELNLFDSKIITNEVKIPNSLPSLDSKGTVVYEKGRTLKIAKSCSSNCYVSLVATWSGTPSVGSYDVIGFRVSGTSITNVHNAYASGTGFSSASTTPQTFTNGFGHSIQVASVSNLKVSTSMYVNKGGTVYGSYQHATSSISYNNSKLYSISGAGYGSVFAFYGAASGIYDAANGVSISV